MRKLGIIGSFLLLLVSGCGTSVLQRPSNQSSASDAITISPSSAVAGSSDLLLLVSGRNFAGEGTCASCANSIVIWTTNGTGTPLHTIFVNSTKLYATVPGALLAQVSSVNVTVQTSVGQEAAPRFVTKPAVFLVTRPSLPPPTIVSLSPGSAPAGSSDLTVTITGTNFLNNGISGTSVVGWSTDPNTQCCDVWLSTTFVSSNELTAVVPAVLLSNPGTASLFVETGDPMGISDGVPYPRSNSLVFSVVQ